MACVVQPCSMPIFSKRNKMCAMHYYRLLRHGSTATEDLPKNIRAKNWHDRFWSQVEKTDGCWKWVGAIDSYGYGVFQLAYPKRQTVKAHRTSYELLIGEIGEGLTIDHECVNTWCVNPYHMSTVTFSENSRLAAVRRAERIVAQ